VAAAATPTRLTTIAAANGHHQPQAVAAAQLAPSSPSPSTWAGAGGPGLAAAGCGGGGQNGPCSTLFVANLGHSCTEAQLTDLFQRLLSLTPCALFTTTIRLRFDGHSTAYKRSLRPQRRNPLAAVTLTYCIYLFRSQCSSPQLGLRSNVFRRVVVARSSCC